MSFEPDGVLPGGRRIRGLETEFGVTCVVRSGAGQRRLGADEVARQLFRSVVAWGRSSNVFLGNGGRLYLDVGSHPEYATAECDTLPDLVAQDRVGQRLVQELADQASARLAEEDVDADIFVFKNNVDSHGNSYGCHENYLVSRDLDMADQAAVLIPFLITRQLFAGAGRLETDGSYQLSQRADHMWDPLSSATTRTRPMINTRDEPHADPARYRRLHVIVGDSNMSDVATWLKVATTDLVLRLVESETLLGDLTLAIPGQAIRQVSQDPRGRRRLELASGRTITAMEIQRRFHSACAELLEHRSETLSEADRPEMQAAVQLWGQILDAFESDRIEDFAGQLDWVAKRRLLTEFADRHQLSMADPRLAEVALRYHDIHPQRGLHAKLVQRGLADSYLTEAAVTRARTVPPATTRAVLRSRFLAAARHAGVEHSADWVNLRILDQPSRRWSDTAGIRPRQVMLVDPFAAQDERVEELIAELDSFVSNP